MAEQKITVKVDLNEQPALALHEWDPPSLGEPAVLSFATFVRIKDFALLALLGVTAITVRAKLHDNIDPRARFFFFCVVAWIVLDMVRVQDLPLLRCVVLWVDHFRVMLLARGMWGDYSDLRGSFVGNHRFAAVLPPSVGKAIHANVTWGKTGVIDVGAKVAGLSREVQALSSQALGKQRYRKLIYLTMLGDPSTMGPDSLRGHWSQRLNLWGDLRMPFSLYLRTRPFPRHRLEVAAGPAAKEAGELATRMVSRDLIMAVYGGTVDVLNRRMTELLGTDRPGKLALAGYGYRVLDSDKNIDPLADDAWGKKRAPALAVAPFCLEMATGQGDPAPIVPGNSERRRGRTVRQWVTFAAKGPPIGKKPVGWLKPAMQGRVEWDLAIHVEPEDRWLGLNSVLGLKASWYEDAPIAPKDWSDKARRVHRHLALLAERATTTLRVGLYASVPETHASDLKAALDDMLGRDNSFVPMLRQREGRASTEPWGRDTLGVHFHTDSHTIAMIGPPDGGVVVENGLFFATSNNFPQPLMYWPWFEHDGAPVTLMFGASGSGKTNAQQMLLSSVLEPHAEHILMREGPVPVVVIYFKPLDEWHAFANRFAGIHIHVKGGESSYGVDFDEALDMASSNIGVAPIVAVNLNDLTDDEQESFTRRLTARVMVYQRNQGDNFRRRFALLVGELRVLTRTHKGALQLSQLANQVRGLNVWLCGDTQFIDHVLNTPADDIRRNAAMVLLFRLDEGEREIVKEKFGLSDTAFQNLAALATPNTLAGSEPVHGMFVGRIHGLWVYGKVERLGELARLGNQTNPTLRENPALFKPRDSRENGAGSRLAA